MSLDGIKDKGVILWSNNLAFRDVRTIFFEIMWLEF